MITSELAIVLDALDAPRVAAFWAHTLGYEHADPVGQYEVLKPPPDSHAPMMLVQAVDDPTPGKLRMHLDLHVEDPEAEAERLVGLGAARRGDGRLELDGGGEITWIAMADPEGNEFDIGQV